MNSGGRGGSVHRSTPGNTGKARSGAGCGTVLLVLAILVILGVVVSAVMGQGFFFRGYRSDRGITWSTIQRKPLPAGSVNETEYYTDTLGWIGNRTQMLSGLKHFYKKTGVQPHVYITDKVSGLYSPTADDLDEFANGLYDELFTDEAHLLLVFFEYGDGRYQTRYVCGTQAKTVIDQEAADILLDYLDRYYYDKSLTDEQFFSVSFADAADRIMTVTRSPWIPVLVWISIATVVIVVFVWWRQAKDRKMLEAQKTEEILKTPLERFGTTEAEQLAKKYESLDAKGGAKPDPKSEMAEIEEPKIDSDPGQEELDPSKRGPSL